MQWKFEKDSSNIATLIQQEKFGSMKTDSFMDKFIGKTFQKLVRNFIFLSNIEPKLVIANLQKKMLIIGVN